MLLNLKAFLRLFLWTHSAHSGTTNICACIKTGETSVLSYSSHESSQNPQDAEPSKFTGHQPCGPAPVSPTTSELQENKIFLQIVLLTKHFLHLLRFTFTSFSPWTSKKQPVVLVYSELVISFLFSPVAHLITPIKTTVWPIMNARRAGKNIEKRSKVNDEGKRKLWLE